MINKIPQEFRRYKRIRNQLWLILKESQKVMEAINAEHVFSEENIMDELLPPLELDRLTHILDNSPGILVFGQDSRCKASLVNRLLSRGILPICNGSWRWVRIKHGQTSQIALTLGMEYELVERLHANERSWHSIPLEDLARKQSDDANCPTILEVTIDESQLKHGVQIFVVPSNEPLHALTKGLLRVLPIFIYALGDAPLSLKNLEELREIRENYPDNPVLFVSSLLDVEINGADAELTESEQHQLEKGLRSNSKYDPLKCGSASEDREFMEVDDVNYLGITWTDQLSSLGFLKIDESVEVDRGTWLVNNESLGQTELIGSLDKLDGVVSFIRNCMQGYLVKASRYLNEIHTNSLNKFILSAFDMAREIQITPKRMQYVQMKESELYGNLMNVVTKGQERLTEIISSIIQDMKEEVSQTNNDLGAQSQMLQMCDNGNRKEWCATVTATMSEIQSAVIERLGEKVAAELVNSINCLRESFIGTLERCLQSLEKNCERDGTPLASDALAQILSAAYTIELHNSSPSFVNSFLERLRSIFKSLPLPWSPTPTLDETWRKKVTIDILNSLSAAKLAKSISTQFRDKVKSSHDNFLVAFKSLESHYCGKLERTEEQRIAIRKLHAPRLARLALESTSTSDVIRFGIPQYTKEIGRGQYGVVFACNGWPGAPGPCAVKSIVPPDEKHYNDLAMEFYYARSIPDDPRIVKLRGSIVDHSYGGCGLGLAVLLITDRLTRDLYTGIRAGLRWRDRVQIAIDVLEGIRYLHSQGLVHRDIKLKNVLLDSENRAKLTDLGFCITEAMMSGSIVGTPVHMAPELLTGHYDSRVDVYAFGILFWYLCAGHVRLPFTFEQFHNKEQLWQSVRRGTRPERLSYFDDQCWKIMEQCWSGEPARRPLLGAIHSVLIAIHQNIDVDDNQEDDSSICSDC